MRVDTVRRAQVKHRRPRGYRPVRPVVGISFSPRGLMRSPFSFRRALDSRSSCSTIQFRMPRLLESLSNRFRESNGVICMPA